MLGSLRIAMGVKPKLQWKPQNVRGLRNMDFLPSDNFGEGERGLVSSRRQCHESRVNWAHWNWPHSTTCSGCWAKSTRFTVFSDGILSCFALIFLWSCVILPLETGMFVLYHCTLDVWKVPLIYRNSELGLTLRFWEDFELGTFE